MHVTALFVQLEVANLQSMEKMVLFYGCQAKRDPNRDLRFDTHLISFSSWLSLDQGRPHKLYSSQEDRRGHESLPGYFPAVHIELATQQRDRQQMNFELVTGQNVRISVS